MTPYCQQIPKHLLGQTNKCPIAPSEPILPLSSLTPTSLKTGNRWAKKKLLTLQKRIESAPSRAETPLPFPSFVKFTPALTGDSVITDIHIRFQTTTVPSTISKTGRLTFPISGSYHGLVNTIPRIPLQRRLIRKLAGYYSDHHRERLSPGNLKTTITNIHTTPIISYSSKWIHGRIWMFPPCRKFRRHQRNFGSFRTEWTTFTNMVLFPTLSTNRAEIGKRSSFPKGSCWWVNGGSPKIRDRWNTMTGYRQSKERRPKTYTIRPTIIIYTYYNPADNHPTWQSHP